MTTVDKLRLIVTLRLMIWAARICPYQYRNSLEDCAFNFKARIRPE